MAPSVLLIWELRVSCTEMYVLQSLYLFFTFSFYVLLSLLILFVFSTSFFSGWVATPAELYLEPAILWSAEG